MLISKHWGVFVTIGQGIRGTSQDGLPEQIERTTEGTLFHANPGGADSVTPWKVKPRPFTPAKSERLVQLFELGSYETWRTPQLYKHLIEKAFATIESSLGNPDYDCTQFVKHLVEMIQEDKYVGPLPNLG